MDQITEAIAEGSTSFAKLKNLNLMKKMLLNLVALKVFRIILKQ